MPQQQSILDELKQNFKSVATKEKLEGPLSFFGKKIDNQYGEGEGYKVLGGIQKAADLAGGALDAANYISTVATGGIIGAGMDLNEATGAGEGMSAAAREARARAKADAQGDPIREARLTNEYLAGISQQNARITGGINMVLDPTNLLTPGGRAAGAVREAPQQFGKAVGVLDTLDDAKAALGATRQAASLANRAGVEGQKLAQKGTITEEVFDKATQAASLVEKPAREKTTFKNLYNAKLGMDVATPRQLLQDPTQLLAWGRNAGIAGREMARAWVSIVDDATVRSGQLPVAEAISEALPARLRAVSDHFGFHIGSDSLLDEMGASIMEANTRVKADLSPFHTAVMGALLPNLSGTVSKVPILGNVVGGIAGFYYPYQRAAFSAFNHFQHAAARSLGFEMGFSKPLSHEANKVLAAVDAVDPAKAAELRQRSESFYGTLSKDLEMDEYSQYSFFTPQDVREVFDGGITAKSAAQRTPAENALLMEGEKLANLWSGGIQTARELGGQKSKEIFADFSKGSPVNSMIIPYLNYPLKAFPRSISMMADHPTGALILYHMIEAANMEAEAKGLPNFASAGVTIDQDTLGLGGLARAMNGGREGTTTIKPLGLLSAVPTESPQFREGDKPFDIVDKTIGSVAPSFSPLIKIPAYMAGFSDQQPGNYSKFQGAAALMPGPAAPTLRTYLEPERKIIQQSAPYDPIERVAQELVLKQTGKALSDPSNLKLALDVEKKEGIYKEAENIYNKQTAVRQAVGLVNPADSANVTAVTAESNRDKKLQITPAERELFLKLNPEMAVSIDNYNTSVATQAANVGKPADIPVELKQDPKLVEWEMAHRALRQNRPFQYSSEREAFIKANRIRVLTK